MWHAGLIGRGEIEIQVYYVGSRDKAPYSAIPYQGEYFCMNGIEWVRKKFEVSGLISDSAETVDIQETVLLAKEMQSNSVGRFLSVFQT